MTDASRHQELESLLDLVLDGLHTKADARRLNEILRSDEDACRHYIGYVQLHGRLLWGEGREKVASGEWLAASEPAPKSLNPEISKSPISNPLPTIVLDDSSPASPLSPLPFYTSHPFVFSNLFALLVLCIGIVGAWMYQIDTPRLIVRTGRQPGASNAATQVNARKYIGQITGMVNVRWADESTAALGGARVPLGRKYAIASGLMEITYDTGAKVILQGPATYEVDSCDGGYLSIGKLTARLEKRGERRGESQEKPSAVSGQRSAEVASKEGSGFRVQGPEVVNHKSEIINHKSPAPRPQSPAPAFAVRTPTALVTDLGTEFGVEVGKNGTSEVHVLKGRVEAKFFGSGGRVVQTVELREGEGRHYEQAIGQVVAIPANRVHFEKLQIVRPEDIRHQRWLAYSRQLRKDPSLIAYYSFESMGDDGAVLANVSQAGRVMDATIEGARWASGRFPGKWALTFHGNSGSDRVELPKAERFRFNDAFSVAIWFKLQGFPGPGRALIAKGDNGFRILQRNDISGVTFDTDSGLDGSIGKVYPHFGRSMIEEQLWHLAVAVYRPDHRVGHKYFYLDGKLDECGDVPLPLAQNNEPVWLGNNSRHSDHAMLGLIDEAAIFARAVSAAEIAAMYEAGNPAWTRSKKRTDIQEIGK